MLDEHGKSIEPDNDKPKPEQPKDIVKAVHTPIIHKALQQQYGIMNFARKIMGKG